MNILVDGRTWSLYSAGISTFFSCAIFEWSQQRPGDVLYILLPKGLDPRTELPAIPHNIILLDYAKRFPKWLPNIIILQWLVPRLCRKLHIDLYYSPVPHLPYFIPSHIKTMVTVQLIRCHGQIGWLPVSSSDKPSKKPIGCGQTHITPSRR